MLTEIRARLNVRCPDHEATRHLTTFIDQHIVDVDVVAIPLRLSKRTFEHCRSPLESRVFATLSAPRSAGDLRLLYSLDLAHDRDRTVPFFSGSLAIDANNADDCFDFALAGQYLPTAGMVSDLPLGTRIAKASASALLHTIATYVKVASARNDAARAGKRQRRLPSGPPPA